MYIKPKEKIPYSLIQQWYNLASVKFESIKFLYNREFALLVPSFINNNDVKKRSVRNLKCHSIQHLDFNLKATDMFKKETPYCFYYSMAKFKSGVPNQNLNFAKRNNLDWNENCYKEIISYDCLIDIDAPDFDDLQFAYESAIDLKKVFNSLNVPYELRFSGMGFHFIIPYKYLPQNLTLNPHKENNLYQFLTIFVKKLYDKYTELIDMGIYDSRRVCKIPYSLALYENDAFVCTPFLNDEEFNKFRLYDYRPVNYPFDIKQRGTKIFNENGNLSLLLLQLNLKEHIKGLSNVYNEKRVLNNNLSNENNKGGVLNG